MMRISLVTVLFIFAAGAVLAQKDAAPKWLDTIPPRIETTPQKRYQATPFFITLEANEEATIWFGVNSSENMGEYTKSINVATAGITVIYFYGEDMYGNRSRTDTAAYILDFQPPQIRIKPDPGLYSSKIILQITADEPCRFYRHADPDAVNMIPVEDAFIIDREFKGYISAVDMAGNRSRTEELSYHVDTSSVAVTIQPPAGIYNAIVPVSFKASKNATVFYTFDPHTTAESFTPYHEPVFCPYGISLVRYYARSKSGRESIVMRANYVIDTIPPRIKSNVKTGENCDTVELSTKEQAEIRYSSDKNASFEQSAVYTAPLLFYHTGRAYVKASARDRAGNMSSLFRWEYKYDKVPPVVSASHPSGTYTKTFTLILKASEPSSIYYTLDGSSPAKKSFLYRNGIPVSKSGITTIRYCAVDEADNLSDEGRLQFTLDFSPPRVVARLEAGEAEGEYLVSLRTIESGRIFYETGDKIPTFSSPVYTSRIVMTSGQVLRYFAVDDAGNASEIVTMDDLQKPVVSVYPEGGVYRRHIAIGFSKSMESEIFWRIPPDTTFRTYKDSIALKQEGMHTFEYYSRSVTGFKSPIRQVQYLLDWTPPRVTISVKKGMSDSMTVFFECSENASIYYTYDGTSPFFSATTRNAGNKFTKSNDRISIYRGAEAKLAFFAEDAAGNQGAISVVDIFRPSAIPNIQPGKDRVHNRILSLSLHSYDDRSQIYYEHHGKTPTIQSPVFKEPVTLLRSDTITAFVVDASGYHGKIDTFVYHIDLPPSPHFTFAPQVLSAGAEVTFNASGTIDYESRPADLVYRWDFDGDGAMEVQRKGEPLVRYTYPEAGTFNATLEVVDQMKRSAKISHEVSVRGICPEDMVFVPREAGRSMCIDRYEWPNKKGGVPLVEVSWVRAKMYCHDVGKRLCTADEWQYACSGRDQKKIKGGGTLGRYPYGAQYKEGVCPAEGDEIYKSGEFKNCNERFGTGDMVGNVWEWVADKNNGSPVIMGGSFKYGSKAHCGLSSESSFTTESKITGFRCCK